LESQESTLSTVERRELEGLVGFTTTLYRLLLFLLATAVVGALVWRIQSWASVTGFWWLLPTLLFGVFLYARAGRWTGGRGFRSDVRSDLASNRARAYMVRVVDAIEVQEAEDEGPTFFLKTNDGTTLAMAGQYLATYTNRGFPWREFEIREGYESGVFLGLKGVGDRLPPSTVREPLSSDEMQELGRGFRYREIFDLSFDYLLRRAKQLAGGGT